MTVTAVDKSTEHLTLSVTTDLDVPVARAWQLWSDPRQLERWWGPPTYPATFVEHDLTPGGRCTYFMTGPEGDQPHGHGGGDDRRHEPDRGDPGRLTARTPGGSTPPPPGDAMLMP